MKRRDRPKKPFFRGTYKAKVLSRITRLEACAKKIRRMRMVTGVGADLSRAVAFLDLALNELKGLSRAQAQPSRKRPYLKRKVRGK